jgi:tyrosyl-tRNA synthetase
MSRLSRSVEQAGALLAGADLSNQTVVQELLELTYARRRMDLSDLAPAEQAAFVAERAEQLQPSADALAKRVTEASEEGRPFIAKFGIDPTGAEIHLGHAVPMLMLSRFQRMGHLVVFIVGDVTAKIGDPSGRSEERPHLTDEDIAQNLATYKRQASPFFDFEKAEFRHNGDWLRLVTLPRLIEITAHVPLSMSLQREDFRNRLAAGHSLTLAELLYSVAMAIDSVEVHCDLEVGGIDQFLNMQMCRRVMEICGQEPELVVATPLLEGTDGTGAKMSKSAGNYVPLTAPAGEVFGKVMSIPDRLMEPYLRALSEWQASELALVAKRLADGSLHPMDLKRIVAGEVTAALNGVDEAMKARDDFDAHFSRRSFAEVEDLPTIIDLNQPVVEIIKSLGFAGSNSEVRRVAEQKGLRLVVELAGPVEPVEPVEPSDKGEPGHGAGQEQFPLGPDDIRERLGDVLAAKLNGLSGRYYLRVGRKLARIET